MLKNMPVQIWLPWKRQVTWTVTCHVKLFLDNFKKNSQSLVAFPLILKKLLTSKVAASRIRPPPPGLNGVKRLVNVRIFVLYLSFVVKLGANTTP